MENVVFKYFNYVHHPFSQVSISRFFIMTSHAKRQPEDCFILTALSFTLRYTIRHHSGTLLPPGPRWNFFPCWILDPSNHVNSLGDGQLYQVILFHRNGGWGHKWKWSWCTNWNSTVDPNYSSLNLVQDPVTKFPPVLKYRQRQQAYTVL